MSDGIKVTSRTFRGQPVPSTQSIDATYSGDDADWDGTPGEGGFDQWKQPVVAATTGNITIATALNAADTLDGVTLAAGDRVLVKDQSTASQNGIYIVGTTPARADDMDEDAEVVGAVVAVTGGTVNAGRVYRTTNATDPVIDTDAINWATAAEPTADAHIADASDAHDASAISVLDSGGYFTGSDVEAALQELGLASASALTNPMTTAGDIIVGGASGTPARLAAGTDGYVLTLASGTPSWAASASGFSDPMTTRGDIIVRGASGTTRLALGTSGQVLTSDGTDVGWAAASGGGGAPTGVRYPVQTKADANANTNSRAITLGSAPTNGNTLILISGVEGTGAITSITQTNVTWTKLAGTTVGSAPVVEIWKGVVAASAGTGITVAYASSMYGSAAVMEWDSLTGTLDQSGTRSDNFCPAITPTDAGAIVFFGVCQDTYGAYYGGFSGRALIAISGSVTGAYYGFSGTTPTFGVALRTDSHTGTIHGIAISVT